MMMIGLTVVLASLIHLVRWTWKLCMINKEGEISMEKKENETIVVNGDAWGDWSGS
jgi:hypothetical protein